MKTFLTFVFALSALAAQAQVSGSWEGALEVTDGERLPIVINLNGGESATLDSPDQGAFGIPMTVDANIGDSVSVSVQMLKLNFSGRLIDGKLQGRLRQGPLDMPVTLTRKSAEAKLDRPQTPVPPFPYSTREVTFLNETDGATLAGTLTIPDAPASGNPVVLMVTGSGLQDRDETALGHKPFAVIADALARKGIASLRYDDRGAGQSTGPIEHLTTAENTRDAAAGIKWLRDNRPGSRIGVIGHSEGARIAYALPADFIVGIGAPALRGDSVLADQNVAMLLTAGVPMKIAGNYADALIRVLNGADVDAVTGAWERNATTESLIKNLYAVKAKHNPWLDYFIQDSPAADIAAVKVPMLIIYGDKDTQVTASLNAPEVKRLAPDARVEILLGLNHLMQHCQTGAVTEYALISETFAPEALDLITDFILSLPEK